MSELQQNDEHFMNKLQEIVPELRKQIQSSVRGRLAMELEKAKERKRMELNQFYQKRIEKQIEQRNQQLRMELSGMMEKIEKLKRDLNNNRPKRLTPEEEQQLIEQTVDQMLGDESMLQEVKARLRPKLEIRVRAALQKELQQGMQNVKREMQEKANQDRQIWTEERINYWTRQSELQLSVLAAEHNQLSTKKQNMETVLNSKKMQKRQAQKQWELAAEKNAVIANLKYELKELKKIR